MKKRLVTINTSKRHWFAWCLLPLHSQYGSPIIVWVDPPRANRKNYSPWPVKNSRQHGLQLEVFANNNQWMQFSKYVFSIQLCLSFPAHAFISDSVCSYHSCFTEISRTFGSHYNTKWKHYKSEHLLFAHHPFLMPKKTVPYRSLSH